MENPTTTQILAVAKDVDCSLMTVYRALRKVRQDRIEVLKEVSRIDTLSQDLIFCYYMLTTHYVLTTQPRASWESRLYEIGRKVKTLRAEFSRDERGRKIKEG